MIKVKQGKKLPCFYFYSATSTNHLAKVFVAENNLKTPAVILAKEQSQGRGRYDRTFLSPKGGVYMSYITPAREDFSIWALYAALAVKRTLEKIGVSENRITIKWPNDVKIDGKKVCGILPESVVGECRQVIMGIGVNVNTNLNDLEGVKDIATSVLAVTGKKRFIKRFAKVLARELYNIFDGEDKKSLLEQYKSCCETLGRQVTSADGFKGVVADVLDSGALLLKEGDATKEICWGEVCYNE